MEINKQRIRDTTMQLIETYGNDLDKLTIREICKKAKISIGLVNYYFKSKEQLIDDCVAQIIQQIVVQFKKMISNSTEQDPLIKIEKLSYITLSYLFDHAAFAKISILSDLKEPQETDNTYATYRAYLSLVTACRPDLEFEKVKRLTFCLVSNMQHAFLRKDMIKREFGYDLQNEKDRQVFHSLMLNEILGKDCNQI